MNPFFAYLIKSSVSLVLLYSLFRLIMRNDRTHALNRFLLLGILLVSAIIPFLNIQFFYEEVAIQQVEVFREFVAPLASAETVQPIQEFIVPPVFPEMISNETVQPIIESRWTSIDLWLAFYLLVISALVFRLVLGVIKVMQIIGRAEKRRLQKIVLAVVQDLIEPFTFLNKVVLSEKDFNDNKNIIVAHEHAHIKQLHTIDLMVCEVFTLMHFFNPFMWLLRRDLKLIHEYQADEAVLNKGIDAKKYQLLVLQKSVGERRFAMANHFTQKPILKRLKMMQQNNRKQWAALKLILFLPMLVVLLQAFARPELITKTEDFIPIKYNENQTEKWLSKWTADNIGKGFYEPEIKDINAPRKSNNVLVILMNARDEYLIENQYPENNNIKQIVKDYLNGINPNGKDGPDYIEKEIPFVGKTKVSKGIIYYQHDLTSSKELANSTIRAIGEACIEVRKEKAQVFFGEDYFELDETKQEAVNMAVPLWFEYKNPKGPTPSVWLPFDGKPSPDPKPLQIRVKNSGEIYVENHKFDTYEMFQENVLEWKKELDKYNEKKRSKGYYRSHVTFDAEVPRAEQKEFFLFLDRNNVHVEWIKQELPEKLPLQFDKLKERAAQTSSDSICVLSVPQGFSPNGDGVHDCFEIKGIYPKYLNAKLMIFDARGQKLFEKKNYGNPDVWGKDNVWWKGTSGNSSSVENDGILPAGNYDYVLELGNENVIKGSVLLAKSPMPQVLDVLPANPNYDKMPAIRFGEKSVNVNGKPCEISNLKNVIEGLLPNDGSQRKVELVVYSITSKERVEQMYAELQNIDDVEIIRKDVTPPPPPPRVFGIEENGKVVPLKNTVPSKAVGIINSSEDKTLVGKVTTFDSIPLIGVNIEVKSTGQSVQTDSLGRFQVFCNPKDKLHIEANGFSPKKVKIKEDIRMLFVNLDLKKGHKNVEQAERYVNVGYGYVNSKDLLYAVSHANNNDIDFSKYDNVLDAIQGQFPGVHVENDVIVVRGSTNFMGNQNGEKVFVTTGTTTLLVNRNTAIANNTSQYDAALVVIDGIITNYTELQNMSPLDISSIDVMKDGSSSVYGSRGANGVVLITTKKR